MGFGRVLEAVFEAVSVGFELLKWGFLAVDVGILLVFS